MCGVDTSLWRKSFRPIFLSLMKAADGEEAKVKGRTRTQIRARAGRSRPGPVLSPGDLRVAHTALMRRA